MGPNTVIYGILNNNNDILIHDILPSAALISWEMNQKYITDTEYDTESMSLQCLGI